MDAAIDAGDDTGLKQWSLSNLTKEIVSKNALHWASRGLNVCELGCGTNPVLLSLAQRSLQENQVGGNGIEYTQEEKSKFSRIVMSDYSEQALEQVRSNMTSEIAKLNTICSSPVQIRTLDWSKPIADDMVHAFDLIVACEVLYYQVDVVDLFVAVKRLLKKDNGGVFLLTSFTRGTTLATLGIASKDAGLRMTLFDIHAVNEAFGSPATVVGWTVLAAFDTENGRTDQMLVEMGLMPHAVEVESALAAERDEDGEGEDPDVAFGKVFMELTL